MSSAAANASILAGRAVNVVNRGEPGPPDTNLQKFAKHQTNVFNTLRDSIKLNALMFAFGEPTPEIVHILSKIYHENIIRLLSDLPDANDGKVPSYNDKGNRSDRLKCMFGILQDTDNNLYVTISESPGFDDIPDSATDIEFMKKRMMMFNLLKSANINYTFPEERTFPVDPIPSEIRWRKGVAGGDTWDTIYEIEKLRKKIKDQSIKEIMFLDPQYLEDNENLYNIGIREKKMDVYWIDSWNYLRNRKTNPTFKPYKKYKLSKNGSTWQAECNNGHLCTESKLFAYAAENGIRVKSFIAYWIGGELPPENHILRGYSYRTKATASEQHGKSEKLLADLDSTIRKEEGMLILLAKRCYNLIYNEPPYKDLYGESSVKFLRKFKNIIQPCAVACPGCFANIEAYKKGQMNKWDMTNCYSPRRALKLKGGRAVKTKRYRKKNKYTRKLKGSH